MPLKSLVIDPGYENRLLIISLCLLFLVPIVSIVAWIVRRIMKARSRPVIGIIATVLWIGGLVTAGMLTTRVANKYNVESSNEVVIPLTPVTAQKLYVEMLPYHDDYAEFKSSLAFGPRNRFVWNDELDDWFVLPYTNIDEDSLLFNRVNLSIRNSADSLFHVRTIAASRGRTLRAAKKDDIDRFSYPIQQKDSVLFARILICAIEQGYRKKHHHRDSGTGWKERRGERRAKYLPGQYPPAVVRKRTGAFDKTLWQNKF